VIEDWAANNIYCALFEDANVRGRHHALFEDAIMRRRHRALFGCHHALFGHFSWGKRRLRGCEVTERERERYEKGRYF
jgi:hypothetical protein